MTRVALYRFFAENGDLLYIGITQDIEQRWQAHARKKPWWTEVATKSVTWFDDRLSAAFAEAQAIVKEMPRHNVVIPDPNGRYPFAAGSTRTSRRTTPTRNVRVPDHLWIRLGDVAAERNTTRAALLVELVRWYLDEYGQPAMPRLPIPPRIGTNLDT